MRPVKKIIAPCILLSLALHSCVYLSLGIAPTKKAVKLPVLVEILDLKKNTLQQIVQQDTPHRRQENITNAKFLSAHNQKVLHQTRAANTGKFYNRIGTQHRKSQALKQHIKPPINLSALFPSTTPTLTPPKKRTPGSGPAQTDDFLKKLHIGPQTLLNTRRFSYYSFFERIKTRVAHHWRPSLYKKAQMMRYTGRIPASQTVYITQLSITIDKQGRIVDLNIVASSGEEEIDASTIEAFKKAEPFPHPPKGLQDQGEEVTFLWDFVISPS